MTCAEYRRKTKKSIQYNICITNTVCSIKCDENIRTHLVCSNFLLYTHDVVVHQDEAKKKKIKSSRFTTKRIKFSYTVCHSMRVIAKSKFCYASLRKDIVYEQRRANR